MTTDLLSMKLHVDLNGFVWSLFADGAPRNTGHSVIEFMLSPASRYLHYRMIGCPENAHLTLGLYWRQAKQQDGKVELCSPVACRSEAERYDPELTLLGMRRFERTASTGGWHRMGPTDLPTYALLAHAQKIGKFNKDSIKLLKVHPVWPALSFIPDMDLKNAAALVATIVDPRWFIDLKHPARGSKLRKYMGLDMKTLLGVLDKGPQQRLHDRCELVLSTWNKKGCKLIERPNNFLHRIARSFEEKDKPELGLLRASQVFIEYLRLVWLAALGLGKKQSEALFVPEYFFKSPSEILSFQNHMQKVLR